MKKVLIAEDEEALREVLIDRFDDDGWNTTRAKNGKEALDKLTKAGRDGFDLLVLDLLMPTLDGFDVLKGVKENPELEDLPIIVLSNLGGDDDIKKAMKLGADDYYVKTQHPMSEVIEKAQRFAVGGHTLNKSKEKLRDDENEK